MGMAYRAWVYKFLLTFLLLGCGDSWADVISPIIMHYYERRPFHYTAENQQVEGLVVTPTMQVFKKIGIPIVWKVTPANRILATLKANIGADCSTGWYKTVERESYARFTLPIYNEKPLIGLSRTDFSAPEGISAKELFAQPKFKLLVKQGFVHGAYLDKLIAQMPPQNIIKVSDEVSSIVRMVKSGIGDLTTTTQEEAEFYVSQAGFGIKDFRVLHFPDVPAVEKRYILCSKQVSEDVINKLNAEILNLSIEPTHAP
jgi:polar amino acid transport system substrate-binding protein